MPLQLGGEQWPSHTAATGGGRNGPAVVDCWLRCSCLACHCSLSRKFELSDWQGCIGAGGKVVASGSAEVGQHGRSDVMELEEAATTVLLVESAAADCRRQQHNQHNQ